MMIFAKIAGIKDSRELESKMIGAKDSREKRVVLSYAE